VTKTIDIEFVRQRDDELIAQGLKLHQRPFHVAMAWMKAEGISGDVFDKAMWDPLMAIYHALYPAGDFSMPAMLKGGVALRDQMYPVRVAVAYGTVSVNPIDCIEIPREELELIFKHYPEQGWRAFYGVADLWDFAYGVSDLSHGTGDAPQLFANARSSLAATVSTRPYRRSA
jgi:hypothetical protein